LYKAKMRLKEAEDKLACCKRWAPLLQHAMHEYHGPARVLAGKLDTDLVRSLALLKRKLEDLEAYLSLAPPSTPLPAGASGPEALVTTGSPLTSAAMPLPDETAPPEATPAPEETETAPGQPGEERIVTCTLAAAPWK
jgi:hypothetical protein